MNLLRTWAVLRKEARHILRDRRAFFLVTVSPAFLLLVMTYTFMVDVKQVAVAVMDRSISFGAMNDAGPLFLELVAALTLHRTQVPVANYVYGLGGRDILPGEIESVYRDLLRVAETGQVEQMVTYLSVRE